jgi:hypothetical protein
MSSIPLQTASTYIIGASRHDCRRRVEVKPFKKCRYVCFKTGGAVIAGKFRHPYYIMLHSLLLAA